MKKLLLQLDSSPLPSVFDRVVAYDGGADDVMSYGGVTEGAVRDLVHGAIFTRGPKDLKNTAVWVGGADMAMGEKLLAAVRAAFFAPFQVSVMLDSNGSNTTAVAAVVKMMEAVGDVRGKRVVIIAGTGPVGTRAAGLFAQAGAEVTITSRRPEEGERTVVALAERFGGTPVKAFTMRDSSQADAALEGAELLLNAGPAGVLLVPRAAWANRAGLRVAVDLNAVPPLGIEGVEVGDSGVERDGVVVFGAIGVGNFKMKVHKACVARLFERNDHVFDAETVAQVARELAGVPA
jgi:D-arabinose 1-dehydrogenase-like Zn-dependent alcohol dehydrogenase